MSALALAEAPRFTAIPDNDPELATADAAIKELLMRLGLTDKVFITIAHSHFTVGFGKILMRTINRAQRRMRVRVVKAEDANGYASGWAFDADGQPWVIMLDSAEHLSKAPESDPLLVDALFEIGALLKKLGLTGKVHIMAALQLLDLADDEMLMEETDERKLEHIITVIKRDANTGRLATWRYDKEGNCLPVQGCGKDFYDPSMATSQN